MFNVREYTSDQDMILRYRRYKIHRYVAAPHNDDEHKYLTKKGQRSLKTRDSSFSKWFSSSSMARMSGMALEGPRKAARIATLSAHQTKIKGSLTRDFWFSGIKLPSGS